MLRGLRVTPSDNNPVLDELNPVNTIKAVALYGLLITAIALLVVVGSGLSLVYLGISATVGGFISFGLLLLTRHFYITKTRKSVDFKPRRKVDEPIISKFLPTFYLYVLGSGGHTTEMIALIKLSIQANPNQHRRYVVTGKDQHSLNQAKALESLIRQTYSDGSAGTHDILIVPRARRVYQPFLTSVHTSLRCALDILVALTTVSPQRAGKANAEEYRYPDVIVTNGPGTGFIVGLVAHLLKILCLVPRNRLQIIFIETWARTHKLGFTGKLFYWTDIPELFAVQSQKLSRVVGKPDIGNVNMRWAQVRRDCGTKN